MKYFELKILWSRIIEVKSKNFKVYLYIFYVTGNLESHKSLFQNCILTYGKRDVDFAVPLVKLPFDPVPVEVLEDAVHDLRRETKVDPFLVVADQQLFATKTPHGLKVNE